MLALAGTCQPPPYVRLVLAHVAVRVAIGERRLSHSLLIPVATSTGSARIAATKSS
jgi:hypothetical protein